MYVYIYIYIYIYILYIYTYIAGACAFICPYACVRECMCVHDVFSFVCFGVFDIDMSVYC